MTWANKNAHGSWHVRFWQIQSHDIIGGCGPKAILEQNIVRGLQILEEHNMPVLWAQSIVVLVWCEPLCLPSQTDAHAVGVQHDIVRAMGYITRSV